MKKISICSLIILLWFEFVFSQKLYVYVPSTNSPKAIKTKLSSKIKTEIVTFSKRKDFIKKVVADKPQTIITRGKILKSLPGYKIIGKGIFKGSDAQNTYAVTRDKKFDPNGKAIGAVDFLGGKKMNKLISTIVGQKTKIKKVKKFKDLLPLISMNMVTAVIVAESELNTLKKSSSQNLNSIKLNKKIDDYVIVASTGNDKKILSSLKKLTKKENLSLGVESWK